MEHGVILKRKQIAIIILKLASVVKVEPLFVCAHAVRCSKPPEQIECLTPVHLELLATEFGITVNSQ